jgi:hypothetical protein
MLFIVILWSLILGGQYTLAGRSDRDFGRERWANHLEGRHIHGMKGDIWDKTLYPSLTFDHVLVAVWNCTGFRVWSARRRVTGPYDSIIIQPMR